MIIYFHKIGTRQSEDKVIYKRPDHPKWELNARVTEDGKYLLIYVSRGTDPKNALFYKDLEKPESPVVELLPEFDAKYSFVSHINDQFILFTDHKAPRGRVISVDLKKSASDHWEELISEKRDTLRSISRVGGAFMAHYMVDAQSRIFQFDLEGRMVAPVHLPGIGSVSGLAGSAGQDETFYKFTSFTEPSAIYKYNPSTEESELISKARVKFKPNDFTTQQVFITSKDGTKVPAFVVHKKSLKLDGNNPTLLYGYGGFDISLTPHFSTTRIQ